MRVKTEVYLESISYGTISCVFESEGQCQARGRAPVFPALIIHGVSSNRGEKGAGGGVREGVSVLSRG